MLTSRNPLMGGVAANEIGKTLPWSGFIRTVGSRIVSWRQFCHLVSRDLDASSITGRNKAPGIVHSDGDFSRCAR